MKSGNNQEEEEDYDDEDLTMKKEPPSFSNSKEGKSNDKANAIRSKHSVTEQRRRSKINERFQILRDLIPNSDQKRDTASFLLEVIEYVQYLQEKVQSYEGSYQGWSQEPTKLMPWRNSHWRVQSFVGHPQAIKNSLGPGSPFPTKFDDNNNIITPPMLTNSQFPVESNPTNDAAAACKALDQQPDLANKAVPLPIPTDRNMPASVSDEGPATNDNLNQQEEHVIEGGTINISSAYSEGLLKSLTQALQTSGLDLSQASISVQIDLGNRANRKLASGESSAKDDDNPLYSNQAIAPLGRASSIDSDPAQKRFKT